MRSVLFDRSKVSMNPWKPHENDVKVSVPMAG